MGSQNKTFNASKIQLFKWFGVSCLLVSVVASQVQENLHINERRGKPDMSMVPTFQIGSRYGRSPLPGKSVDRANRLLMMVPRVDRFYFGSRYGKRGLSSSSAAASPLVPQQQEEQQPTLHDRTTFDDFLNSYGLTEKQFNDIKRIVQEERWINNEGQAEISNDLYLDQI
ncbi:hypothetical protein TKK_0012208 [Trichogramma kaykai]|uniref:Uncharacterized protein n=1 Tax=Trichogramma kaykai TaxID=54128 RepID=A0ABD2WMQ3_9HYME